MGLMIHSLAELPSTVERDYYIYLLDYGWSEPVAETLHRNFDRVAAVASANNAIVLRGTIGSHFSDEVLSWHSINGQSSDNLLPAILLTTRHPKTFHHFMADENSFLEVGDNERNFLEDKMALVPLRKFCRSAEDVVPLLESILSNVKEKSKSKISL